MDNLAGVPAKKSNPIVLNELTLAGIPTVHVKFRKRTKPEVLATFIGVLHFADGTLAVFSRQWYYWNVCMNKDLPYKEAKGLNDIMGGIVRVDGYGDGTDVEKDGCRHWNVDAQEGLNVLASVLKYKFGELSKKDTPDVTVLAELGLLNDAIYG
ncbi:MAG: hypothetical protein V1738_05875 [Patescibacteria group bacterium]